MNLKYFNTNRLISFLLILAIIFQLVTNKVEELLQRQEKLEEIVGYINVLSTLGLIGLVLGLINTYGWKLNLFKSLIDVPNLNGRYKGILTSSYKDFTDNNVIMDCIVEIKQTASSVHVCAYYAGHGNPSLSSKSHSVLEQLVKEPNGLFSLYYIYTNDASTLAMQLGNHDGTAHLTYHPDNKTLEGNYYNKRGNKGTIKVQFENEQLLGRFQEEVN